MSKFNKTNTFKTVNLCGHPAYKMDQKQLLVTQVLTSLFAEYKFYGDNSDQLVTTAESVVNTDPQFVSNLARYARKEMHLRSVTHVLTAILAHNVNGKPFVKQTVEGVVERPDDITEILACYLEMFGKPVPNSLKKALGAALYKFNAFQISKYNGAKKSVKFRDVLCLTHVKPQNAEQDELFRMILTDTLPVAERWETELSAHGNQKEVWERLIADNQLGYMAILRNLRNIIKSGAFNLQTVLDKLQDKEQVLKSKQLPFRFLSSYREVDSLSNTTSKVLDALETAIEYSVENMPKISGKTVIAIDTSYSMCKPLSERSKVLYSDVARLLGVLASKICDEFAVYTFDSTVRTVTFSNKGGIISTALNVPVQGGCTYTQLVFKKMTEQKVFADRLIILSDNQVNWDWRFEDDNSGIADCTCQRYAHKYRELVNPDLWIHAVDLQGYGTQQFMGPKTNILAGWGERLLEFIQLSEQGFETQLERIKNYK